MRTVQTRTWSVDWPGGPLELSAPAEQLAAVVERPELPRLGSPVELVHRALQRPIGCPPLKDLVTPGDRVALLVTDVHDSLVGDGGGVGVYLLDRLNALGVPDNRVTLVHAAGLHGHHRARQRLGEPLLGRVRYLEHDPTDESALAFLGPTLAGTPVWINRTVVEADCVIGVGGCNPSLFGFQGGGGIILPGVAGRDSLRHNHSTIMCPEIMAGWGPGNPLRADILDSADLVRLRLKIDFAANTVIAGYPREAWPAAVRYVQQHVMTPTDPVDIYVLAPPNARELTGAIYMQLELAVQATRPGGVVIVAAAAGAHRPIERRPLDEVLAETVYVTEQWNQESSDPPDPTGELAARRAHWRERDARCKEALLCLPLEQLSRILTRRQGEARTTTMVWSHRRCLEQRRVFLVSAGVPPDEGGEMGFAFVTGSYQAALDRALEETGGGCARIAVNNGPRLGYPLVRDRAV